MYYFFYLSMLIQNAIVTEFVLHTIFIQGNGLEKIINKKISFMSGTFIFVIIGKCFLPKTTKAE